MTALPAGGCRCRTLPSTFPWSISRGRRASGLIFTVATRHPTRGFLQSSWLKSPGTANRAAYPLRPGQADQDVYLVSDALLSTTGLPGSMPIVHPVLTGRVFHRTELGELPIAGASVVLDFSGGMGWAPSARTMTDASGRYLLCNARDVGFGFYALVSKPGYTNVRVRHRAAAGHLRHRADSGS